MSKKLSPSATDILNQVKAALQPAEELGGVDGTSDYIALMEAVAFYAVGCLNTAVRQEGGWHQEARIAMVDG
jgi:hypothetical protein